MERVDTQTAVILGVDRRLDVHVGGVIDAVGWRDAGTHCTRRGGASADLTGWQVLRFSFESTPSDGKSIPRGFGVSCLMQSDSVFEKQSRTKTDRKKND